MTNLDKENGLGLSGKLAIVTGASSGVGRETAIQLSNGGAQVVLIARREDKLQETLSRLDGVGHSYMLLDISDFDKVVDALKEVVAGSGRKIDCIAHCAGAVSPAPLRSITRDSLDFAFKTNLYSFAAILKCAASKRLFSDGGAIVGVSGTVSLYGQAGNGAYAASKGAVNTLVKCAAKELASRRVRVNAVCPGGIRTEMVEALPSTGLQKEDSQGGSGKLLLPGQVASVIVSLLSDHMQAVSGQVLEIDEKLGGDFC